jgi:hypothetical protein
MNKETFTICYGDFWDQRGNLFQSTVFPWHIMPEVVPGQGCISSTIVNWYINWFGEEGSYFEADRQTTQNVPIDFEIFTQEGLRRMGR